MLAQDWMPYAYRGHTREHPATEVLREQPWIVTGCSWEHRSYVLGTLVNDLWPGSTIKN